MAKKIISFIYKKGEQILSGRSLGRTYPAKIISKKLRSYLKQDYAYVDGQKMYLDENDSLRLSINGIYEPKETEVVKKEIKKGYTVLDIGANIGYYTLIFAKLVGLEGKVYAFEPDPKNFEILKKNVQINNYKNVVLIQKAVSDRNGEINLVLEENNTAGHNIRSDNTDGMNTINVDMTSLDEYFKNFDGNIDFIKMDVEGSEFGVIKGMKSLLARSKNVKIMTEFDPFFIKKFGVVPEEFLDSFLQNHFKFYDLKKSHQKKLKEITKTELLKNYTIKKENHTNLFLVKKED